MSRPKIFQVKFNNPNGVFHNGQNMKGTIIVENQEEIDMEGLVVKIDGRSGVNWKDNSRSEVHLLKEVYILGRPDGEEFILPPGHHEFEFSFNLPINIPSSFRGEFGKIGYFIEVTIKRALFKFDHVEVVPFLVNSILDLRLEPTALSSVARSDKKFLCCFCCKTGPVAAQVMIPKCGFVPGEVIPITAKIQNKSSTNISSTTAKLIQTIKYISRNVEKKQNFDIAEVTQGPVEPGQTATWKSVPLLVPNCPPSRLDHSSIIDISYEIEFLVCPDRIFSVDLDVNLPILIGNVSSDEQPIEDEDEDRLYEPTDVPPTKLTEDLDDDNYLQPIHLNWRPIH